MPTRTIKPTLTRPVEPSADELALQIEKIAGEMRKLALDSLRRLHDDILAIVIPEIRRLERENEVLRETIKTMELTRGDQ